MISHGLFPSFGDPPLVTRERRVFSHQQPMNQMDHTYEEHIHQYSKWQDCQGKLVMMMRTISPTKQLGKATQSVANTNTKSYKNNHNNNVEFLFKFQTNPSQISWYCASALIIVVLVVGFITSAAANQVPAKLTALGELEIDSDASQIGALEPQTNRHLNAAMGADGSHRPANIPRKRSTTTEKPASMGVATSGTNDMVIVHEREFVSSQARVQIECQRDKTLIKVNFTRPFNGILGAGKLESTKCKLSGMGSKYYELQVLHNATQCDTQWDNVNSSISNTLFIRFHHSLETGSDIAKNIMCRLTVGDLVVGRRPIKKIQTP